MSALNRPSPAFQELPARTRISGKGEPLRIARSKTHSVPAAATAGGRRRSALCAEPVTSSSSLSAKAPSSQQNNKPFIENKNVWEELACLLFVDVEEEPNRLKEYVQWVTVLRVGCPSFVGAAAAKLVYPSLAMAIAHQISDSGVFAVVASDASQYIQNVLTTSGLVFSLLVGQTYFFMVSIRFWCLSGYISSFFQDRLGEASLHFVVHNTAPACSFCVSHA